MAHADADIEVDFDRDWIAIIRRGLRRGGHTPAVDDQRASFQFFNLQKRLVEPKPRRVHVSNAFECPREHQRGYDELRRKVESGDDVRPHLSRFLADLDKNDALLNDWGIHHLHLGTTIESDGFAARTGPVLFVRFESADAYFIAIQEHGAWSDKRMLDVVQENWPTVFDRFQMVGVVGLERELSSEEIAGMRKAGIQTFSQLGAGRVIGPPGGGYSTSGLAIDVVRASDHHRDQVRLWEEWLVKNKTTILERLRAAGKTLARPAILRLELSEHGAHVVGTTADGEPFAFKIPPSR